MPILTSAVPIWVSILFICTFPIVVFLIAKTAKEAAFRAGLGQHTPLSIYRRFILFCGGYFIYSALLSLTGAFRENTLPPRILIFTTLPLMLFYLAVVSTSKLYRTLLDNARLESLIRIHTFRFVGVFFIIAYAYGALPKTFAFIGGIGDIVAACTAIFVANAVQNHRKNAHKLVFIWNIIGLWDIVNVLVAAVLTTKYSIENGTQNLTEMGNFPFCWIAAFAPATIVFLHISIFKKLKAAKG